MTSELTAYLRAGAAQPFAWGESDCCSWVCTWVLQRRGVDPMASWRGQYAGPISALRRINDGGGMLATVCAEMAAAGLAETNDAVPGDVGLIQMGDDMLLGIRTKSGWACKAQRGVVIAPAHTVKAWSV